MMDFSISPLFLLAFMVSIVGITVSTVLYFSNRNESFSARLIAGFLCCASLVCLSSGFYFSSFYLLHPHTTRMAVLPSLFAPALSYLYVRTTLYQQIRLRKKDWLLFLPAVLYKLSFLPYYFLPASAKVEFVIKAIADKSLISLEPEGLLPLGWGFVLRVCYGVILTLANFVMLLKWRRKIFNELTRIPQNVEMFKWLFFYAIIVAGNFFILLVEAIFHVSRFYEVYNLITLTISSIIIFNCFYLLAKPNILYGMKGFLQQNNELPPAETNGIENTKTSDDTRRPTLTTAQELVFKVALENHFELKKPYLKAGYKINDLSKELDIATYLLSAFINQEYGKNFSELVNDYRVTYIQNLVQTAPEYRQFTLEALGKMAGFNSRGAFIFAVKKKTGQTPSVLFGTLPVS